MNKGVVIAAAVVAAAAAAGIWLGVRQPGQEAAGESVAPPVVQVTSPERGDIQVSRSLIGSVEPADMVYVIPMAAGEITEVYVNAGDYVTEGQALCKIDTKQVDSARLQLDAAQVQLEDAQANLERMKVLYQTGDISAQNYEQVESAAKAAQIQYDSAKLAYEYQMDFSEITATISGRIESSSMEVHGMATQSSPLCVIAGEGSKTVTFSVTEAMLAHVKAGDTVLIEKSGSQYTGTITEVGSMVSTTTGLFDVKASVESADSLISGTTVRLNVITDGAENVLVLPVDTVYYSSSEPYVYTYDAGTVHEVPVETGISDDEKIEIVSGLTEADQVITTWSPELYEGAPAMLEEDAL